LRITGGRLDLDDVGTEVGHDRARSWHERPRGHLDDPHALERTAHALNLQM
jgi:hypothetical protein